MTNKEKFRAICDKYGLDYDDIKSKCNHWPTPLKLAIMERFESDPCGAIIQLCFHIKPPSFPSRRPCKSPWKWVNERENRFANVAMAAISKVENSDYSLDDIRDGKAPPSVLKLRDKALAACERYEMAQIITALASRDMVIYPPCKCNLH
tara:strand:- start:541 stop:990 length:450 start_codon:yes stop_codon:yes gene_type:complete